MCERLGRYGQLMTRHDGDVSLVRVAGTVIVTVLTHEHNGVLVVRVHDLQVA